MSSRNKVNFISFLWILLVLYSSTSAQNLSEQFREKIYDPGKLKPFDSITTLKIGDRAPNFILPCLSGQKISLRQYRDKKNVVISFVPAVWIPVSSDQWQGYNKAKSIFEKLDAILFGITTDNIPTLDAWEKDMGKVWFYMLSDFWPHGAVAEKYGVLRSNGVSERAIFIIDKRGIIRYIDIHDINKEPKLEVLVREIEKLED